MSAAQSPLQEERALQARVKRCRAVNPDMTQSARARRFGIGIERLQTLLRDEPAVPPAYRRSASRTGRPLDEVVERKEKGYHWCAHCAEWRPCREFLVGEANSPGHHSKDLCVIGKRRAKSTKKTG